VIRVGHKGADLIVPGNTIESFHAAAEAGVDIIEFDVLRPEGDFTGGAAWKSAPAGPATGSGPLLVLHNWAAARRGDPLTLDEALDAFCVPPLTGVKFDLDIKIPGREDEIIEAIRSRDLTTRAMTSGTELPTLRYLSESAPEICRGWTVPRVTRDWTKSRTAKPLVVAGMAAYRARLPGMVRRDAQRLGVEFIWTYHGLITPALANAAHDVGCNLIAWTVDNIERMRSLAAMGVDGICTNDPRLFAEL
jgi:glycerophosphoryl diester phosphodiesterase